MSLTNRKVLYVSYNGMLDWLGQSQVIPYLRELSGAGVRFTLLSFERPSAFSSEGLAACKKLKRELADNGIDWHWLRYHKRPSLLATSYDVLAGIRYASRLIRDKQIEMVHARAHIPATIALALKRRFGVKMIFDIRGLMAEEYIDAKHWKPRSIPVRITKAVERRALSASDGVVTLTEAIWKIVKDWDGLRGRSVPHRVIPCCADLKLFRFDAKARDRLRRELAIEDKIVIVYSGSIDGWYLTEEMADFMAAFSRVERKSHFLWLTNRGDRIQRLMQERGIANSQYTVQSVPSREVPAYLSASDAALAFIKPCFSKLASSPTKTAEYLACGLPLIINAGVGDSDRLIEEDRAGVLLKNFEAADYQVAATEIVKMCRRPVQTREHARSIAERSFDVSVVGLESYEALYEEIFTGRTSSIDLSCQANAS